MALSVTAIPPDVLFRVYTACPEDTQTLILDLRPYNQFKKGHLIHAFCIRLASTGRALLVGAFTHLNYPYDCVEHL